jgi:hypothetical protein
MDRSVWISYFSTFCNSIGIDPVFVFTAFIMTPILFLVWWVNTKNDKQRTHLIWEIRTTELPEQLEFFYAPTNPMMFAIFGVVLPLLFLRYFFFKSFSVESPFLLVLFILAIASGWTQQYVRSRYVNKPALILSKSGIKYFKRSYSWSMVEKIEVVKLSKFPDKLVLTLKPEAQLSGLKKVSIEFGGFEQKWLPEYAQEYFLRCGTGSRVV